MRLIDLSQFGVINEMDSREALFSLTLLTHQKLRSSARVHAKDLGIISELYWHQTAKVKEISTKEGIQGCVLSPFLFNLYSEKVFNEAAKILSTMVTSSINLRYADDTVLIARTLPELQFLMDCIVEHSEQYSLSIIYCHRQTILLDYDAGPNW